MRSTPYPPPPYPPPHTPYPYLQYHQLPPSGYVPYPAPPLQLDAPVPNIVATQPCDGALSENDAQPTHRSTDDALSHEGAGMGRDATVSEWLLLAVASPQSVNCYYLLRV